MCCADSLPGAIPSARSRWRAVGAARRHWWHRRRNGKLLPRQRQGARRREFVRSTFWSVPVARRLLLLPALLIRQTHLWCDGARFRRYTMCEIQLAPARLLLALPEALLTAPVASKPRLSLAEAPGKCRCRCCI